MLNFLQLIRIFTFESLKENFDSATTTYIYYVIINIKLLCRMHVFTYTSLGVRVSRVYLTLMNSNITLNRILI